ncbi:hypothetical protein FRC18_005951 [Serendipita sp. 400]|nr:hypothetical protein FRC18_005951 [Serendipita sp. 400]
MFVATNIRLFAQLLSQVAWNFRYNADTEAMIGALRDELAQDAANAITLQSHNKEKQRLKDFFRNVLGVVAPDVTQAEREDQERLSCMTTCSPLTGEANGSELVTISISVLGRNDRQVERKVRRSCTFADLACRIIRNQPENPAPDFWCKQRKPSEIQCDNNFIWAYQDQPVPIVEALTVEGSGVEVAVIKDNYIVAVVRRDEMESGKPIGQYGSLFPRPMIRIST